MNEQNKDVEELIKSVEAELEKPEEDRKIGRRGFIARGLKYGAIGAVVLESLGFTSIAYRIANFFENNKNAARMVENIALEAELISEYSEFGAAHRRVQDIMNQNEVLKAEYRTAIAEQKAAELEAVNAQLANKQKETIKLFEEWQKIHAEYSEKFEKDQNDLGLMARRSKAIAFDTAISLDQILHDIQNGTTEKLVEAQKSIYDWIAEKTGIDALKHDDERIKAFKDKYQRLVDSIKDVQANKRQIQAVDSKFKEVKGKDGLEYIPWMDYCERRGQLEKSYLDIRKVEDGMHDIPDMVYSKADIEAFKSRVNYWGIKADELNERLNANVEMVRQYTGKDINSKNLYDSFKNKIKWVVYGAAAAAALLTAGAIGYGYTKIAGLTGLSMDKTKKEEAEELSSRQQQRLLSRRELLNNVLPYLKGDGKNESS